MACSSHFDAIVKMETLEEDLEYIRQRLGSPSLKSSLWSKTLPVLYNLTSNLLSTLSPKAKERMRSWLEIDLEALGYEFFEFSPQFQPYFRRLHQE